MSITYLRATFDHGFVLIGKAIRCVSRVVYVNARLDPKVPGGRILVALVFLFLLLPTTGRATTYIDPQVVWWGGGTTYLPDPNAACAAYYSGGYLSGPAYGVTSPALYDPSVSEYPGHAWAFCCTADFPCASSQGPRPQVAVYTVPVCAAGWESVTLPNALGQYMIRKCQSVASCPANSSGTFPDACRCNTGYEPDPTGTSCMPVTPCPVPALTPLPAEDACTQALENLSSTQAQKDAACGTLSQAMQDGKTCLENKLSSLGTPIPLAVTADIRNVTYQAHFREIWDKMEALVPLMEVPDMQAACATRRAEIAAEKGCDNAGPCEVCNQAGRNHCLKAKPARPSPNDAQHIQGNAIDVSNSRTIAPLQNYLKAINPPQEVEQFLDSPPNCNLMWGGTFIGNPDPVHFYVR